MASIRSRRTPLPLTLLAAGALTAGLLAACGSDGGTPSDTTGGSTSASSAATEATSSAPTQSGTSSTAAGPSTSGPAVTLEQPAIFPAADVAHATPEEAAEAFVTEVLGVPVSLGEYQGGDSRSGEIEVWFQLEGGPGLAVVRTVLLMRQLGLDGSWFVLAAVNENASITAPAQGDTVPAAPLTVTGTARGFEGAVTVSASVAGHPDQVLDREQAIAGSAETPEPFTVTLDLSAAEPGATVMLLVRGGVGNEDDPGETGAIAVTIAR